MHKYMRAVGFCEVANKKELQKLIKKAVQKADKKAYTTADSSTSYEKEESDFRGEETLYAEYKAEFGDRIGICVRGEYDENNIFTYDYYFPFLRSEKVSSTEDLSIEQHIEKLSFAGIADDYRVGITLIFYLQNIITYLKLKNTGRLPVRGTTLSLSGLSVDGRILLPIRKNEQEKKRAKDYNFNKSQMLAAAKQGDEDAIENLTLEDMDTYSNVQKRILNEDIYSLVDTYFMPYGVECDLYSILGEITECEKVVNSLTGEEIYIMELSVNDLSFDICINQRDLMGEPMVGRRFKGVIWLQGTINYPEDFS